MVLPTEGGGSGSAATSATVVWSRAAAGTLLAGLVGSGTDRLGAGANLKLALLSSAPALNVSTGVWDISGAELTTGTAPGYARITVPRSSGWTAPAGAAPVHTDTTGQVSTPVNSGVSPWPPVLYVAVLDNAGTNVLTVLELDAALQVPPGMAARVPAGALQFTNPSA